MIGAFRSAAMGRPAQAGYRYWRLIMTAQSWYTAGTRTYIAAYEIKLFASSDGSGSSLASAKPTNQSSCFGGNCTLYGGSQAVDGSVSTAFFSRPDQVPYQWWSVDLESPALVRSLEITHIHEAGNMAWGQGFDLQSSDDGTNWTTRASLTTTNTTTDKTVVTYTW